MHPVACLGLVLVLLVLLVLVLVLVLVLLVLLVHQLRTLSTTLANQHATMGKLSIDNVDLKSKRVLMR